MSKDCNMHGGSVSVITPAAYPQGQGWSEPNNLPGSNDRNVSDVGNHFSFNSDAGALPDPLDTNPQSGGACGCEAKPVVGGKKRRQRSPKKKGRKTKGHKGKKGKKSRRKTKGRKGRKTTRKGHKSHVRGKYRRTKRKMMRGGMGLFDDRGKLFQPVTNLVRNSLFGAGEMVNQWQGKPAPLNPAPTSQDRLTPMGDVTLPIIPDVPDIHQAAGQAVANI